MCNYYKFGKVLNTHMQALNLSMKLNELQIYECMCVSMCLFVSVYGVCLCVYMYVCLRMCVYECACLRVCMHAYVHV